MSSVDTTSIISSPLLGEGEAKGGIMARGAHHTNYRKEFMWVSALHGVYNVLYPLLGILWDSLSGVMDSQGGSPASNVGNRPPKRVFSGWSLRHPQKTTPMNERRVSPLSLLPGLNFPRSSLACFRPSARPAPSTPAAPPSSPTSSE